VPLWKRWLAICMIFNLFINSGIAQVNLEPTPLPTTSLAPTPSPTVVRASDHDRGASRKGQPMRPGERHIIKSTHSAYNSGSGRLLEVAAEEKAVAEAVAMEAAAAAAAKEAKSVLKVKALEAKVAQMEADDAEAKEMEGQLMLSAMREMTPQRRATHLPLSALVAGQSASNNATEDRDDDAAAIVDDEHGINTRLRPDKAYSAIEWRTWANLTVGCSSALQKQHSIDRLGFAFTHIPKTAGSMLEALGARSGVCWGRFLHHGSCGVQEAQQCIGPWFHQPPRGCVPPSQRNFCVIRAPAERIVSAYRFAAKIFVMGKVPSVPQLPKVTVCSTAALNSFVQAALWPLVHKSRKSSCHVIPHSRFDCNAWLDYANLPSAFDRLMNQSGMRLQMHDQALYVNEGACAAVTVSDLDAESEKLIRTVYADDLRLLHRVRMQGNLYIKK
jgi:hypothetical protein